VPQFRYSDAEYADFINYVSGRSYNYSTNSERAFASLKETAQREKYYAGISNELEALGKELTHDKRADLDLFKSEIKTLIEKELVVRYYFETGKYKYMFANDPIMKEALAVLGNVSLYNSILKGEGNYKVIGKPKG